MASYWAFTSSTMPLRSMWQRLSRPTVTDTSFTWAVRSFSSWAEQKWKAQGCCCRGLKVSLSHTVPLSPQEVETTLSPVTSQGVRWLLMPSLPPRVLPLSEGKGQGWLWLSYSGWDPFSRLVGKALLLAGVEVGLKAGSPALCCPLLPHWGGIPKKSGKVIFRCGPPHLLMEHVRLLDGCWAGEGEAGGYKIFWAQRHLCYEIH